MALGASGPGGDLAGGDDGFPVGVADGGGEEEEDFPLPSVVLIRDGGGVEGDLPGARHRGRALDDCHT